MGKLDGKIAIITGASRGQGAAEARQFIAEGARVVMTDIIDEGAAVATGFGDAALFLKHDVSDEAAWSKVAAAAIEHFGGIDILVNNAGLYLPCPIQNETSRNFERHFRVNQLGVFLGMQAVIPAMTKARKGSIINTSSVAGVRGAPGMVSYSATKFAIVGMTKSAAHDLAPYGIRVNSIHPGLIDTQMLDENSDEANKGMLSMVPLGRMGTPREIADLVVFLASDAAGYITGAQFTIDGGVLA